MLLNGQSAQEWTPQYTSGMSGQNPPAIIFGGIVLLETLRAHYASRCRNAYYKKADQVVLWFLPRVFKAFC